MAQDFLLPDIGEGIVECELVEWLVKEGDRVEEDQAVADVMTDKALVQIPSMHNGVITRLYHAKGDIAKVHAPLYEIEPEGEVQETEVAPVATTENLAGGAVKEFLLPDIGEGIVECEVVEWLVAAGDEIVEDQPICDVMTDKALVQIPAIENGVVSELFCEKGNIAKVHAPLFSYRVAGEADSDNANTAPQAATQAPAVAAAPVDTLVDKTTNNKKAIASPAVRRVAREMNIDLTQVQGSGKNGRVLKSDLLAPQAAAPVAKQETASVSAQASAPVTTAIAGDVAANHVSNVEPMRGIKAAMARQMVDSVTTIPHFTYSEEVDMTELIALRGGMKDAYKEQGIKLTMMPFFIKALSLAIKEYPVLNSQLTADGEELHYMSQHNIGMAVDSKVGLLVPNVKSVQNLSIVDVANEVTRLTDAARAGRLAQEDMKHGTITISNIGALGGTTATPIINKPEVAIVALGKVQKLPRFDDNGNVVARQIMNVSWSGDHRVIDGGTIARFCNLWKSYLENPSSMMMAMS
ncbi:dihydrolipoyllysine-residue acetyltransferase [Psychrobium sp. MM17-31]|uniref:dihydrolipoyllysine-residue acetyltransferase n=1 Tax=Psychrobium sp. MM17-31 TaxID=2917758 RepID=UPI001EF699B4|nr:dihydrolipoyllysine-residue acetyltransferase [Psychrobium sp. MM17-31]MCG7531806.1 dihydrolipoyllysine-residue acetyltransferase [Psychrobium sp. MM17-31]